MAMANEAQIELWNGRAAAGWIQEQQLLDSIFHPFEQLIVDSLQADDRCILDVGCGTGATTLAIARRLGGTANCAGVDVSEPMIAVARARAARDRCAAQFLVADAQEHDFGTGTLDAVVSRFGVMFFDNPVRAFSNLRRATRSGGQLHIVTFRGTAENSFMTTAERAAAPLMPALPPRLPDSPGQFAFSNAERARLILEQGGWSAVRHRPLDVPCVMPVPALMPYLTRLGPVGQVLGNVDELQRQRIIEAVMDAFSPFIHGDEVRFTAACWMVDAVALPPAPVRTRS
jgi:SAM-dependent methyltransferase